MSRTIEDVDHVAPGTRRHARSFKPAHSRRPETIVREFSRIDLEGGIERVIAVLSREGDRPALMVGIFRNRSLLTRMLFHVNNLEPIQRALLDARDPRLSGRRDCGVVRFGHDDRTIEVFVRRTNQTNEPAVLLSRRANGARVGGLVTLTGVELDGLEAAVEHLRDRARGAT